MRMSKLLKSLFVLAVLASGALLGGSAAQADTAPQITLFSDANCDQTGTWQVTYAIRDLAPVKVVIVALRDAFTGAALTPLATEYDYAAAMPVGLLMRSAPPSATQDGITVVLRRADRTTQQTITRIHPLPGGCAAEQATECVHSKDARYRHTFNGAAGVATIERVGKPLCAGEIQDMSLMSWASQYERFDAYNIAFSSITTKVSVAVKLPPCQGSVRLIIFGLGGGGAFEGDYLAGARNLPGSRSSGPLALYTIKSGPLCSNKAHATVHILCSGNIRVTMSNEASATTTALVAVDEVAPVPGVGTVYYTLRAVALEPGEKATLVLSDLYYLRQYGGQVGILINETFVYTPWQIPAYCQGLPHRVITPASPAPRRPWR